MFRLLDALEPNEKWHDLKVRLIRKWPQETFEHWSKGNAQKRLSQFPRRELAPWLVIGEKEARMKTARLMVKTREREERIRAKEASRQQERSEGKKRPTL